MIFQRGYLLSMSSKRESYARGPALKVPACQVLITYSKESKGKKTEKDFPRSAGKQTPLSIFRRSIFWELTQGLGLNRQKSDRDKRFA